METQVETAPRSPLAIAVTAVLAFTVARVTARFFGLFALLAVVIACVGALTIGILVLRIALLH